MKALAKAGIATAAIATGYFISQSKRFVTTHYTISNKKIPDSFNGFKIAQVSDFHNAHFGKNNIRLIAALMKEHPDVIVITGDAITYERDVPKVVNTIQRMCEICPVFYVTGNHEYMCHCDEIFTEELKTKGVHVIDNEKVDIVFNNEKITIAGLKDPQGYGKKKNRQTMIKQAIEKLKANENTFNILLSHQPQMVQLYSSYNWDLVFCGHAHGGQWRIGEKAIYAPGQGLFPPYTAGIHNINSTQMVVSRGLGWTTCCLRLNNPAELVIVTLKNA